MLSAVIHSQHSYPAMPLAGQLAHQRSVHSGPLVLGTNLFKNQRLQQIGDQPVSRIFLTHYCVYWTVALTKSHDEIWITDIQSLRAPPNGGFPRYRPLNS